MATRNGHLLMATLAFLMLLTSGVAEGEGEGVGLGDGAGQLAVIGEGSVLRPGQPLEYWEGEGQGKDAGHWKIMQKGSEAGQRDMIGQVDTVGQRETEGQLENVGQLETVGQVKTMGQLETDGQMETVGQMEKEGLLKKVGLLETARQLETAKQLERMKHLERIKQLERARQRKRVETEREMVQDRSYVDGEKVEPEEDRWLEMRREQDVEQGKGDIIFMHLDDFSRMVEVQLDAEGNIADCAVFGDSRAIQHVLHGKPQQQRKLVDPTHLSSLITSCHNLQLHLPDSHLRRKRSIYPGTKWCGAGNVANHYNDLGHHAEADACCRQHDYCPDSIPGWSRNHGDTNYAVWTWRHCDCETTFYNCLRRAGTTVANHLRSLYFDLLSPSCLQRPCLERGWSGECTRYAFERTRNPRGW